MLWCHSCDSTTKSVATCGPSHADNWQWSSEALRCGAKRQGTADIRKALADRWIVVAGDSIARFFFAALLRLASSPDCTPSRQTPYECFAPCEKLALLELNMLLVTDGVRGWEQLHSRLCMDIKILSTCCPATSEPHSSGHRMLPI